MSEQGRLIINARGENAKAIAHGTSGVMLQVTAHADRTTHMNHGTTVEIELTKRECAALALQMLDAAGYSAAISDMSQKPPRDISLQVAGASRVAKCPDNRQSIYEHVGTDKHAIERVARCYGDAATPTLNELHDRLKLAFFRNDIRYTDAGLRAVAHDLKKFLLRYEQPFGAQGGPRQADREAPKSETREERATNAAIHDMPFGEGKG